MDAEVLRKGHLADDLHQYFTDKEAKEVARIAQLVRFFELTTCLNYNLARYFDDNAAPLSCGHCSVCRGQMAKLVYSEVPKWLDDAQLKADLHELKRAAEPKGLTSLSLDTQCRFLAGMTLPLFTRLQVRKLSGFGRCEHLRYAEIKAKLAQLADAPC